MSVLPASRGLTPEEANLLPDAEAFELENGTLKERETSPDSVWIAGKIFSQLDRYAEEHGGIAFADGLSLSLWPDAQGKMVRPDACYFAEGRLPGNQVPTRGVIRVAPDVVVEVISPGEKGHDIDQKASDYLQAGVAAVWNVYPNTRRILIHRAASAIQVFPDGSVLDAMPEMPGFACPVVSVLLPIS